METGGPLDLFVVPHTHWDREWYQSFQDFRRRLVRLTDRLIDLLEREPAFTHFHFDGQTIVLEDYLEIRPENRARLRRLIASGRIAVGPWYVLPDEFLVSGESLIRNLQIGHRLAAEFGKPLKVGYLPDQFGHIAQMPQILKQFGIEDAVVWRGVGADVERAEFLWQAPDGSQVFAVYLPGWGYSNGRQLPTHAERFQRRLEDILAEHAPFRRGAQVLVMNGTDHQEPQPELPALLTAVSSETTQARIAPLVDYIAAARPHADGDVPVHIGELRSSLRAHLLPGVSSSRVRQKQRDFENVGWLERYAEPIATWADRLEGERNLVGFTDWAWKLAVQNHPHDSICGCSIDAVHRDMEYRFDQVESVARRTAEQGMRTLASRLFDAPDESRRHCLVVYNPNGAGRVLLRATIYEEDSASLVALDADGAPLPLQTEALAGDTVLDVELPSEVVRPHVAAMFNREFLGYFVNGVDLERVGNRLSAKVTVDHVLRGSLDMPATRLKWLELLDDSTLEIVHVLARTPAAVHLTLQPQLAGFGLTAIELSRRPVAESSSALHCSEEGIENEFFQIGINADGSLSIVDKQLGLTLPRCNWLVDDGDRGDEYNFDALLEPQRVQTPVVPPHVSVRVAGPLMATLSLSMVYSLPVGLDPDRDTRSSSHVEVPIEILVSLYAGIRRVDFVTSLDQRAHDHRLRAIFETPLQAAAISCEQAFGVVERSLTLEAAGAFEQPIGTVPQKTFSLIEENGTGVALFNRGVPEVEAIPSPQGTAIALTLTRSTGWLSRGDLRMRNGHAGPGLETPGAQSLGSHRFEYSLTTYAGGWEHADVVAQAHAYAFPPFAISAEIAPKPPIAPVAIDNPHVVVSAITPSGRGSFVMRCYNPTGRDQVVDLSANGTARVVSVDLLDRPRPARLTRLRRTHGGWRLLLRPSEIASLRFVAAERSELDR